ncbi:hypothetical protein M9Y10_009496 [Tritrichomonas musculus]|uniref:Uncharacterized protein n=1 Tax=Tritrichomonas musculus TaxID=1915356 RepID=A0ABR2IPQ9_9EUKA
MIAKKDDLLSQRTIIIIQQMEKNPQELSLDKAAANTFFEKITNGDFLNWFAQTGVNICFPFEALMYALDKTISISNFPDCIFFKELYNCAAKRGINPNQFGILDLLKDYIIFITVRLGVPEFEEVNDINGLRSFKMISSKIRKFIEEESEYHIFRIAVVSEAFLRSRNMLPKQLLQYMTLSIYGSHNILEKLIQLQISDKIVSFENKTKGISPGTIAILPDSRRCFIKSHKNYPLVKSYLSSLITSITYSTCDSFTIPHDFAKSIREIDLKELFAYKVLEKVGFGPKTGFIINGPLHSGLYIYTNEIKNFLEVKKLKEIINESDSSISKAISSLRSYFLTTGFNPIDVGSPRFILNLTAFDIIARSMLLFDLNENNLGFIDNDGREITKSFTMLANLKPCLVDFIVPTIDHVDDLNRFYLENESALDIFSKKNRFVYAGLISSFLTNNTFIKYPRDIFDDYFIPLRSTFSGNTINMDIFKQRRKKFGLMAFQKILKPLNEIDSILQSTYHEVLELFIRNNKANDLQSQVFKLPNQLKQAEELREYAKAISLHLRFLFEYVKLPNEINTSQLKPIKNVDDYFKKDEEEKNKLNEDLSRMLEEQH